MTACVDRRIYVYKSTPYLLKSHVLQTGSQCLLLGNQGKYPRPRWLHQ